MAMLTGFLEKLSGLFKQGEVSASLIKARPSMGNVEEKVKELEIAFYPDLSDFFYIKNKISPLSYSFVRKNQLVIVEEQIGKVLVAMLNPFDLEALEQVRFITQKDTQVVFTTQGAFEKAIEQLFHQKENEASEYIASLQQNQEGCLEEQEGYDLLESASEVPVIHLLNVILAEAVQQGSSDIHFEPAEQGLEVRYRVDGVLHMRHTPPLELQTQLITRIKVLARLDIAEHRLPQDGRIKLHMGQRQIDFRVSTVPVAFGERIVLRILDKNNVSLGLDKIGMDPFLLSAFNKLIRLSEGIVLVTGPTGSGKTTTLYSALSEINSSEMNIMTIEDPVEYKLPGMAQIGVNPRINLNFATGLRHILRQDPDVIMIGEIRDKETAEIAIQSALTGHLVFSTLHTNDAPSALTRLVDMGIEPYLLSSSVLGVLAQRLVRRICPHCIALYLPSDQELKEIGLSRREVKDGLYRGNGCEVCYGSGFKGRHAIYELMYVDHLVRQQLLLSADATTLQKVALAQGMSSLRQQGAVLVQKGITTTSEVLRVTKILEC
ncbi:type II secretion system ATPase GspE [Candidatus Rhabdochlamydia sp. T3358]|uniref:type II secretion system ATPase GspE n=1 Tax=Candidatus Rhabdochlamydia sp. T3358 TaxID=2099795 RepID=UPI0010B1D285|nr:type II secretion system ATPase GspE [Candidatus Rhabdochlamydia sp. T3358]VHN99614.1 Type II secretion system protein E [Candidatus Rhabdochlamydia sp. T3358]